MTKRGRTDGNLTDALVAARARKPRQKIEQGIAATCVEFMELDSWRAIKMEPISRREWGKGTGEVGQPDYLFLRYNAQRPGNLPPVRELQGHRLPGTLQSCAAPAEALWVEFKRPGGKTSLKQLEWHEAERARGALTWLAGIDFPPTVEGYRAHYMASGLARRVRA